MNEIINKVANELNLPYQLVLNTYKAYWRSIRDSISLLPLKDQQDENSYSKLYTSYNIPSLGKLHCTYQEYLNKRKSFNRKNYDKLKEG
jgi:hypothetical protein